MNSRLLCSIAAAMSAVVFNIAFVSPAHAQVKAALVQDIDEPARMPYQESLSCPADINATFCTLNFRAVPEGRRREIRLVSCTAEPRFTNVPLRFIAVELVKTTAPFVRLSLPFQYQGGPNYGGQVYTQTSMYFESGDTPVIELQTEHDLNYARCTVIGRDILLR